MIEIAVFFPSKGGWDGKLRLKVPQSKGDLGNLSIGRLPAFDGLGWDKVGCHGGSSVS